jgi:hypothetical protein
MKEGAPETGAAGKCSIGKGFARLAQRVAAPDFGPEYADPKKDPLHRG